MGFLRLFSNDGNIDHLKEIIFKVTWAEIYGPTFIYYGVFQEKIWGIKNAMGEDSKLDLITAPHFLTSMLSFNIAEIKLLIKQIPKFIETVYIDHSKLIFDNNPIILNAMKDCIRDTNHISSLRLKIDDIISIYEQKVIEVEKYFSVIDFNLTRIVKFYESTSEDIPADLTSGISRLLLVAPFGSYLNSPSEEIDIKDVKEFKLWNDLTDSINSFIDVCMHLVQVMSKDSDDLRTLINQLFDATYGAELSCIQTKFQQSSNEKTFKEHLSIEAKGFRDMLSHTIYDHENNVMTREQTFKLVENLLRKFK